MLGSLLTLCALMAAPAPAPATTELHPYEKAILELTNAERAKYRLPALVLDDKLEASARKHAAWMTNSRSMVHTTAPVAENIAMGQRTCADAVNAWMNSPGHRANILNPNHHRIGVACYTTPDGLIFWCQQFQN